jgi:hypothetical protein
LTVFAEEGKHGSARRYSSRLRDRCRRVVRRRPRDCCS